LLAARLFVTTNTAIRVSDALKELVKSILTHEEGMREFRQYRRKQIAELRPYEPGEKISCVSISAPDKEAGSPKAGDMIGRNPKNHADKWLVAAQYFADNFEPL
jgi:hypothetical protein